MEDLYETVEKHQELLDKNIHNQVMLQHVEKQLDKALADIDKLKDTVRENGKNYWGCDSPADDCQWGNKRT